MRESQIPDAIRVEHIAKSYGVIKALHDINMHLMKGEILGLLGDNGAGKSTLIKILTGFIQPTDGKIFVKGKEVKLRSVTYARSLGIETVYQDLALANELTVYHNMFLNRESVMKPFPLLNNRAMREQASEALNPGSHTQAKSLGRNCDPHDRPQLRTGSRGLRPHKHAPAWCHHIRQANSRYLIGGAERNNHARVPNSGDRFSVAPTRLKIVGMDVFHSVSMS